MHVITTIVHWHIYSR